MRLFTCLLPALLLGCAQIRDQPEDASSWYDGGELLDVVEPLEFTDQPYAAPSGMGIGDYQQMLFPAADGDPVFGPGDGYATSGCPNGEDNALPFEIEGTVLSANPRFKNAANGNHRLRNSSPGIDSGDPALGPDPDGSAPDMGSFPYVGT